MNKKILRVVLVLSSVILLLYIFRNQFWGEAESNLTKSKTTIEENASIDVLKGLELKSEIADEITSSEIAFSVEGLFDTKGYFKQFEILFKVSEKNPEEAKFKVLIDVNSIFTNEKTRDKSLLSEEFFNTASYPNIVFSSKSLERLSNGYKVIGTLEMMGLIKEFSFPFEFLGVSNNDKGEEIGIFKGEFDIDRVEFGMLEDVTIGNIVHVEFYTELIISK